MDKYGCIMDISKTMRIKLTFSSEVYEQLTQKLSIIDTFKGSWKVREKAESIYLKELRKVATIESAGSSTRIEGIGLNMDSYRFNPRIEVYNKCNG